MKNKLKLTTLVCTLILAGIGLSACAADSVIEVKSKPRFECRIDKTQMVTDNQGHQPTPPLNIWMLLNNNGADIAVNIGQLWPKAALAIDYSQIDKEKEYTFVVKTEPSQTNTLLSIADGETVIYKK